MTESEYKTVVKLMIEKLERYKDEIAEKDAEIERYRAAMPDLEHQDEDFCGVVCEFASVLIEKARAKAVKGFAERLKTKYSQADILCPRRVVSLTEKELDNFVKEMVGGNDASKT